MFKKSSVWLLILCLIVSMMTVTVFASEASDSDVGEAEQYPNADVTILSPLTLTKEDGYQVYDGSLSNGTTDRPLQIVMNFKANDSFEEAQASPYGKWKCDFYLTFNGLENGSVVADNCYLAGNYGEYGWIVIPTDGLEVEEGVSYPVVSGFDANLTYENICDYVKSFTAAIYIDNAILEANPDFEVSLALKMTDPENENNVITVGAPAVYDVEALTKPNAEVTVMDPTVLDKDEYSIFDGSLRDPDSDLPLQVVMNFKALDSLVAAQQSRYGKWICDFYLTFEGADGTFSTKDCYLAGNYGSFGWIAIPADYLASELEYNVAYPVVAAYDPNLTYENICDYVKDFTASIFVADELIANPNFKVKLELRMTNPENADDYMVIGEPAVYTAADLATGNDITDDITDIKGNTQIGGDVDITENADAIESAKQELKDQFGLTDEQIAGATVELEVVFDSLNAETEDTPESYSYNVAPMYGVGDSKVKIETLNKAVTFKLPVPTSVAFKSANVYHEGTLMGTYDIKDASGEKYVEVSSAEFSTYTVEPVNTSVAQIGDVQYATLAEALEAANAGDEIVLLADVTGDVLVPANVIFNGNGFVISGGIIADGDITFSGVTTAADFDVNYVGTTVNIGKGASLQLTGTARLVIGHACIFNIEGEITDAKTADKTTLTPSLVAAGASFTGAGVTFNVTNAYVKFSAYCSSKNSAANGTFNFNIENSIWEQTGSLVFSAPTSGMDPTVNFNLKDSVLDSTSHLVFAVTKGEIVFDNSNVNVGVYRQLENRSSLTIKNGSVVYAAHATSSNAKNPGTTIVENATYVATGDFSGSDLGTGTLILKSGADVTMGKITGANVQIDATGMAAGDEINLTADLSNLAGTVEVVNNNKLEAEIVDGKIVLTEKPAAQIGDVKYATLKEAFAALSDGDTLVILAGEYSEGTIKLKAALSNVTVKGEDGAVLKNMTIMSSDGNSVKYSGITFDGIVFEGSNIVFTGARSGEVIYKDITITNCEFNNVVTNNAFSAVHFNLASDETIENLTFTNNVIDGVSDDNGDQYPGGLRANYVSGIVTITGNKISNVPNNAIQVINANASKVVIENNILASELGAITNLYNVTSDSVSITGNQFLVQDGQKALSYITGVDVSGNYWNGSAPANLPDGVTYKDYYTTVEADGTLSGKVELPYGTLTNVYTSDSTYWGECGGNAKESFVFKFYNGDTYMGYTSLNNVGGIIDGSVYVSWNIKLDAASNTDEYWTMAWEIQPTITMQPTRCEQWVDGVKVAEAVVEPNWSDKIFPVTAAVTDENGTILSYVNGTEGHTFADAVAAGGYIYVFTDVTADISAFENVTLSGNNVKVTNTCTDWVDIVNLTVANGVTLEIGSAYFTDGGDNVIEGTLSATTVYNANNSKITVRNGGNIVTTGMIVNRYHSSSEAGIYVYGDGDNSTVEISCADTIGTYSGTFYTEDAVVEANMLWIDYLKNSTEESDAYAQSTPIFKNSDISITKELRFYKDATITLIDSDVTAGTVQVRENATPTVSVDENSSIKADAVLNLNGASSNAVIDENGNVSFVKFVAKIGDVKYETLAEALAAVNAGETITLLDDVTVSDVIVLSNSITIDGNGKTITYTGSSRIINITVDGLEITLKNLNLVSSASYCERGINIAADVDVTLDNVSVKGENVTYALNLPGSSKGSEITIKDSDFAGCIALNVWGANAVINATDSDFTSVDKATHENYAAISANNDGTTAAEGAVITITGGTITALDENDQPAIAIRNSTATGTINVSESTVVTGTERQPVAIVTYNGYNQFYSFFTLQDALDKATNDPTATLKLLKDITVSETLVVNGEVVLDLNGKTVSGVCNASQDSLIYIENSGKLTINDSSAEKTGKITYAQGTSNVGWTIDLEGELVLNDGTIELTGSWSIGYAVDVRPNSWGTEYTKATTFVMNGGNVISSDGAVRVASSSADTHKNVSASFVMNGGKIDAAWDGVFIQQSNATYDDLSFVINGGVIESDLNPVRVYGPLPTAYVNDADCMSISLNGGTLTYTGTETRTWIIDGILRAGDKMTADTIVENGVLEVSSAIAQSASAPDGYKWVANGTSYVLAECDYVAAIGDKKFETLADAFAAAQNGETVTLLSDLTIVGETYTIADGVSITLDMNGKKLTVTDDKAANVCYELFYIYGELTVKGNGTIEMTSTSNDTAWAKSSTIFHNRGGVLTVENGTYKHLGGTCMAFAIDNSGNWFGDATTNIKDGYIESTYIAIRNRMEQNSHGSSGKATVNVDGGTIVGVRRAIWGQASSTSETSPATGAININDGTIVGSIETSVAAGSVAMTTINGGNVEKVVAKAGELTVKGGTVGDVTIYNNNAVTDYAVNSDGVYVVAVAKIGDTYYATLADAIKNAVEGDTIVILDEINEGTIKLPAVLKDVTFTGGTIKNTTIMASDGNSFSYIGLTFDGIVFDNSRLVFTGWRNGDEILENLTVNGCTVKNLHDDTNMAFLHINKDVSEPVNGLTFTDNVLDGVTGGSKSGIYTVNTGKVTITGNTFNNIVFRPALVQLADCDGVADEVVISDNSFSNTTRLQVYGSEVDNGDGTWTPSGTDTVTVEVNENVFENISGYYICTWGINGEADISKNYYDSEDLSGKIYWNNIKPTTVNGLKDLGVYPVYTELNADGTINTESAIDPVASVGTIPYATLADAVAAAKVNGGTLTLLADANESITFNYPADGAATEITLDLNGFTITSAESTIWVSDGYTITIKDSSTAKTGKIISTNTGGEAIAITRNGHVILESGYVYNDFCAVWMYNATENGTFVMNGGTLEVPNGGQALSVGAGKATINGGKIICNKVPGGGGWNTLVYANGALEITGGTFRGTVGTNGGPVSISGGTFSYPDDPNDGFRRDHLADGYEIKTNDDGSVTVYALPTSLQGSGTAEDPYLINNIDDLKFFRNSVNSGNRYNGKFVKLTADIDLNDEEWTPIGDRNVDQGSFLGTFDGDNHKISNLWISEWNKDGAGFFSKLGNQTEYVSGTVKNVTFENVTIISPNSSYIGVIAQTPSGALVENVHIIGEVNIQGYGYVGGISGHGYGTFNNCSVVAEGSIIANYWGVGAILGFSGDYGAKVTNATVTGVGEGLEIHGNYGGAASVTGSPYGAAVNGATVSNVEITSNSDYCMGYVSAGGKVENVTIENVIASAAGKPITPADAVAKVNSKIYIDFADALAAAQAGDTIVLLADVTVTEKFDLNGVSLDLGGHTMYLKTTGNYIVDTVSITNGTIDISGNAVNGNTFFTVGGQWAKAGSVLNLDKINLVGDGYRTDWAVICVHNGTSLNITNSTVDLKNDNGTAGGFIKDTSGNNNTANITITDTKITLANVDRGFTGAKVTLDTVELTITGGEHGINGSELTVKNSTVSISDGTGRGITLNKYNSEIINSTVTLTNMGEGGIRFKTANALTVDAASTLVATSAHADVEGATLNGIAVTGTEDDMSEVTVADGETTVVNPFYAAQIGDVKYATLEEAFKAATEGCTIEILNDVTVDYKWDCRDYATGGSHSQFKESVTINGNGHTIEFTGTVSDGNWNTIFRFEENATVKNLTIDISGATGVQRVITAKKSLTVEALIIVGTADYGVIFGEGASADDLANAEIVIKNSTLTGTKRAISDNRNAKDVKSVEITGNVLNAKVGVSASDSIIFNDNVVNNAYVDIRSYSASNTLDVTATGNTLTANADTSGNCNMIIAGGNVTAQDDFVRPARGEIAYRAYIEASESREAVKVDLQNIYAKNSVVVKLYDANGNLLTTTTLKAGGFEGDWLTTNIVLSGTASGSWDTVITAEKLTVANVPTKAELWIDDSLLDSFEPILGNATDAAAYQLPAYVALDCVYKEAKIGDTYYATIADAIKAAQAGETVYILEGTYAVPSVKAGITIEGIGNVLLEGTLSGTLENLTLKNLHIKGANAQRWAYAKGDLVFENVTFEATSVYALHFDGISDGTNLLYKDCTIIGWAAMGGSPASCVFDGCTIKDNGSYGVIRTYFDAEIKDCTFDVANANLNDVYEDGIHAVEGAKVTVNGCTNANGAMADIVNVHANSVVVVDNVEIKNVAKIGDNYYLTLADAVAAANAGDTITLLANVELTTTVGLTNAITIDGKGFKITPAAGFSADGHGAAIALASNLSAYVDETYTIKNVVFDGFNGVTRVLRANFCNAVIEDCVFTNNNVSEGVISSAYAKLNVDGCTFDKNTSAFAIIVAGADVSNGTKLISSVVNGSFTENEAAIAVIYLAVSGNVSYNHFEGNIHTGSNPNAAAILAGPYTGKMAYAVEIHNNSFVNAMSKDGNALPSVFAEDWTSLGSSTFYNLNSNYWGSANAPVFGSEYASNSTHTTISVANYYTTYTDGTLSGLTSLLPFEGSGSATDPYQIGNLEQLETFRNLVDGGESFDDKYFVLTSDINLGSVAFVSDLLLSNWTPIGTLENPFKGTFDGNGKTVKNLSIAGENNVGFFGYADQAVIKNLTIENVLVIGADCVGGIAGQVYSVSLIENCHVKGTIQIFGQTNVGGIAGKYYTKVKNCSVIGQSPDTCFVRGDYHSADHEGDNIGGIIGHCGEDNDLSGNVVKNISVIGTRKVGGIVGIADQNTAVTDCVVENVIIETDATADYANSKLTTMSIGGLIGQYQVASSDNDGVVSGCTVKGVKFVNTNGVTVMAGPIVGGARGGSDGMLPPSDKVAASDNLVYMSTIEGLTVGTNNLFLMVPAANVDGVDYYTLEEAFKYAADGSTVTLLIDAKIESALSIDKAVTINGNGYTISGKTVYVEANVAINGALNIASALYVNSGELTIAANATVTVSNADRTGGTFAIYDGGKLTVASGAELSAISIYFNGGAIDVYGTLTAIAGYDGGLILNGADDVINVYEGGVLNAGYVQIYKTTGNSTVNVFGSANVSTINDGSGKFTWNVSGSLTAKTLTMSNAASALNVNGNVVANTVTANGTISLNSAAATLTTASNALTVASGVAEHRVVYADGAYSLDAITYVAEVNGVKYETLAAAIEAAQDGETITLIWSEGDAPIVMVGSVYGKTVTITGTATVDWGVNYLFIGRGGAGDGTVIFDNANLTSASETAAYGIHVSGREKDTTNKYNGTLVIKNSTIELDYLINKGTMTLDNSTLTVKNGFSVGGRPAIETESGVDATATIDLTNGSKLIVNNHNGMGLGYEAIGIMNVSADSTFECTQAFLVTAKGTMNIEGTVIIAGTLTNNGKIVLTATTSSLKSNECGNVTTTVSDYKVVYADGAYSLDAITYVAEVNGVKYETLAAAIEAADAGDTITLIANVDESFTINKNVVLDGGNFEYTGTMTLNKINVTIKNVNFVEGNIYKHKSTGAGGNYTIVDCTFNGNGMSNYAINLGGTTGIVIDGCTAEGYGFGFLQVPSSNTSIDISDVTVVGGNYAFKIDYSGAVSLTNVKISDAGIGIYDSNFGLKTYTLTNCEINADNPIKIWDRGTGIIDTFEFVGNNKLANLGVGGDDNLQLAKLVLTAGATLTAPEELTVESGLAGYMVKYADGAYSLVAMVAQVGDKIFESLQEAINEAQPGETVILLKDINLTEADCVAGADRKILVDVQGKDITLDMNGKKIYVEHRDSFTNDYIVAVIRVGDGAGLTVTGNGTIDVNVLEDDSDIAYMFWKRGTTGHLTIENGTFHMNDTADSMVYTNGNEIVYIKGGNWTLDAYGERGNREPWIFNAAGAGDNHVIVTGGTFNADINRQFWSNEVIVPETYYTVDNGNGTWTVNEGAVAAVYTGMITGPYFAPKYLGYKTFEEAFAAAIEFNDREIKLLANVEVSESFNILAGKIIVLDLNGNIITGTDNTTKSFGLFTNNGTFTVKDSVGGGKITLVATNNNGWARYSSVVSNGVGGMFTLESGTIEHLGGTSMSYGIDNLTNGKGTYAETVINGGTVESAYIAIRQFLNGVEAQNILTVNGGVIGGANSSIYFQDPSANANSGTLTIGETASVNNRIYLEVTEGSTEWPVEISIAAVALGSNATIVEDNIPAKYEIVLANGTYGVVELDPVAQIGETPYYYITDAIEAAQAGDIITLLGDLALTESLVIEADDNIVLDLNGYTVSMNDASGATVALIKNNGILTINDSSEAKSGKITFNSTTPSANNAYASNAISNYGTITINGGTIENTSNGGACYALDNYAGSTANIAGGKLYATRTTVRIFNWTNGDAAKATLNISGGEIVSENGYAVNVNAGNAPAVALNVTGGTLTTNDDVYALAVYVYNYGSAENLTVDITDGTFNGAFALNGVTCTTIKENAISISGGTFGGIVCYGTPAFGFVSGGTFGSAVAEELCKSGYIPTENADGTYGVKVGSYAARNTTTGVGYETFAEAMAAVQPGETVMLLEDVTLSEILVLDKAITLDGNGKTLTSSAARAINVSGADGVTIKNLTINTTGERAINVIQNATNVTIENVTATASNYTVNVAASAPNAVVTIKDSTLTGLNVVNVTAVGSNVTVDNTTINCNDASDVEKYAALCLGKDATNGKITATSVTINVTGDSHKGRLSAKDGEITINGSTDDVVIIVAIITYAGSDYYYGFDSLAGALEFAKAEDTVTVIRDAVISENVEISNNVAIDLNGYTVTFENDASIVITSADAALTAPEGLNVTTNVVENEVVYADGKYAVKPIEYAAEVNGVKYRNFSDALAALTAGSTLKLMSDVEVAQVMLFNETCLDLNGFTLTTQGFAAFQGSSVVDNGATKGLLIVPEGNLALMSATYPMLPVRNEANTGYVFVEVVNQFRPLEGNSTGDGFSVVYRPSFGSKAENEELFSDGAADNHLTFTIHVHCINDGGEVEVIHFTVGDDLIKQVYSTNSTFKFTVSGATDHFASYEVHIEIKSNSGVSFIGELGTYVPESQTETDTEVQ